MLSPHQISVKHLSDPKMRNANNVKWSTTIASSVVNAESQISQRSKRSKHGEFKVTGSALSHFFAQPFTAQDFSLPNIERKIEESGNRRAHSIQMIAPNSTRSQMDITSKQKFDVSQKMR
jgi:hypothetical protein